MILEYLYTAENKKERKALLMMSTTMQDAGMDVTFHDENGCEPARLSVKESRRKRRSPQEVAEAALTSGGGAPTPMPAQ